MCVAQIVRKQVYALEINLVLSAPAANFRDPPLSTVAAALFSNSSRVTALAAPWEVPCRTVFDRLSAHCVVQPLSVSSSSHCLVAASSPTAHILRPSIAVRGDAKPDFQRIAATIRCCVGFRETRPPDFARGYLPPPANLAQRGQKSRTRIACSCPNRRQIDGCAYQAQTQHLGIKASVERVITCPDLTKVPSVSANAED